MAGQALSLDAINQLLSTSKTRGDYEVELRSFISSGEAGIEVDLTSGTLAGKDAKNVATGFNNARKKMTEDGKPAVQGGAQVKVILRWVDTGAKNEDGTPNKEGHVFLINTAVLGDGTPAPEEVEETS